MSKETFLEQQAKYLFEAKRNATEALLHYEESIMKTKEFVSPSNSDFDTFRFHKILSDLELEKKKWDTILRMISETHDYLDALTMCEIKIERIEKSMKESHDISEFELRRLDKERESLKFDMVDLKLGLLRQWELMQEL